ncbi:hypothetical protein [Streptomyces sp. NPDC091649]|uniref:hypothetical protein n=1 Tax=Streptomyces sp. NPDC091649 TaxID=3366004 RepID=UPI0038085305
MVTTAVREALATTSRLPRPAARDLLLPALDGWIVGERLLILHHFSGEDRPASGRAARDAREVPDHALPQATGGGVLAVVREDAPGIYGRGAIGARTVRRPIGALRW